MAIGGAACCVSVVSCTWHVYMYEYENQMGMTAQGRGLAGELKNNNDMDVALSLPRHNSNNTRALPPMIPIISRMHKELSWCDGPAPGPYTGENS